MFQGFRESVGFQLFQVCFTPADKKFMGTAGVVDGEEDGIRFR